MKPRRGDGSRFVARAYGDEDVGRQVRGLMAQGACELVMEEELVGVVRAGRGDYVSVESVARDGRIEHWGVTGKFPLVSPFRECGEFLPSGVEPSLEAEICNVATQALVALSARDGVFHTELKLCAEGPRIIEVNGRLGGMVAQLYRRAGRGDLMRAAIEVALGVESGQEGPEERSETTVFSFSNIAPKDARRVLKTPRPERLGRRLGGKWRYNALVRSGDVMRGANATDALDLVSGDSGDVAEAQAGLLKLGRELEFEFEMVDGSRTSFRASEMPALLGLREILCDDAM